ncbi:DNA-binding PadR family transcriptional regulator [Thermosporothrix hazakensis]|uniref:DNA-binding PadR family transcriptional regulator n=2 Tax=Thermosporothrix TaxID=768650 RepID=A0A326U8V9_THEHA|nr:PadR family transcriptional regulator [Thermosporothrix hazakensis]PZW32616.1 DNA-binding PadR family transcriptional regulator [Thermosporothrix hazakensis]BBH87529.1 PadR family transcriptional regulator [Thermosporothrix sp. COM3]GCE49970.1 PadR family transcriptional regulator [Thermosporothrix hazakensis]
MDERMLLLLGLLKAQRQHGYQMNEFIEHNLKPVIDMKRSTAYSLLDRLCELGYVESSTQQEGKRPRKKVYTLTEAGEQVFLDALRAHLSQAGQMSIPFEIGLMFVDHLPSTEVREVWQQRLHQLAQHIEVLEAAPTHGVGQGVDLALAHRKAMLKAEHQWLVEALEQGVSEDH